MADPGHVDVDFDERTHSLHEVLGARQVPWKAVALAFALFAVGLFSILAGFIIWITDTTGKKHGIALLLLGVIVFIPGSYHTVIACKAFMGRPGFSFSTLPDV